MENERQQWAVFVEQLLAVTGFSKAELGRRVGVTGKTILNWIRGDRFPNGSARMLLRKVADEFNATRE